MAHENETTGYAEKGQTLGSVLRQVFTSPETHAEASVSRLRGDHRGRVGARRCCWGSHSQPGWEEGLASSVGSGSDAGHKTTSKDIC